MCDEFGKGIKQDFTKLLEEMRKENPEEISDYLLAEIEEGGMEPITVDNFAERSLDTLLFVYYQWFLPHIMIVDKLDDGQNIYVQIAPNILWRYTPKENQPNGPFYVFNYDFLLDADNFECLQTDYLNFPYFNADWYLDHEEINSILEFVDKCQKRCEKQHKEPMVVIPKGYCVFRFQARKRGEEPWQDYEYFVEIDSSESFVGMMNETRLSGRPLPRAFCCDLFRLLRIFDGDNWRRVKIFSITNGAKIYKDIYDDAFDYFEVETISSS